MPGRLLATLLAFCLLIGNCANVQSQELIDLESTGEADRIPQWLEDVDEPVSGSELLESLEELRLNPLDLNAATPEELEAIPGLNPLLVKAIVDLRSRDPFKSVSDLDDVPGFSPAIRKSVAEFLTVRRSNPLTITLRSRLVRDLNLERGYVQNTYAGNPFHFYHRIGLSKGPLSAGFVVEKDPGETAWNDFNSGFLQYQSDGIVRKVVAGGLRFESAQGLVFWGPSGFSKGGDVLGVRKKGRGLLASQSAAEFQTLTGAGISLKAHFIEAAAFGSISRHDASFNTDGSVSAIQTTGLHRTENEIAKRDRLKEEIVGGRVAFSLVKNIRIGATAYHSRYSAPFAGESSAGQHGKSKSVWGADYDTRLGKHIIFGEFAGSGRGAFGFLAGTILHFETPAGRIGQSMLLRHYQPGFQNRHGAPFAERSGTSGNETGLYLAAQWKSLFGWTISAFHDWYRFPKAGSAGPPDTDGREIFLEVAQRWSRRFRTQLRFRDETRTRLFKSADTYGRDSVFAGPDTKRQIRLQAEFIPSPRVRFRSRVAVTTRDGNPKDGSDKTGLSFYEDVRIQPVPALILSARITFFGTDGFETALYEVENDLPGVFGIPAFFDRGIRWYVMAKYSIGKTLTFSARYSDLSRDGAISIGSGNGEVTGNQIRTFKAQLDLKL